MSEEEALLKVLNSLQTKADVAAVLREIDLLSAKMYVSNPAQSSDNDTQLISKLVGQYLNECDVSGKGSFLETLKRRILDLDYSIVTLAFKPTPQFIQELSMWLEKNMKNVFPIEFKIDSTLLGGIVLESGGKRIDLSVKTKLENYFKANKNALLSNL